MGRLNFWQARLLGENKAASAADVTKLASSLGKKRKKVTPPEGNKEDESAKVPRTEEVLVETDLGSRSTDPGVGQSVDAPIAVGPSNTQETLSYQVRPPLPEGGGVVGPSTSVDKGKAKVFTAEPRLCFPDRPMTVEDSAIRDPEVAWALVTFMSLPKDQEILDQEGPVDLGMQGFRCLIEAGLRFSALENKRLIELRGTKALKKERKAEVKRLTSSVADLLKLQSAKDKELADLTTSSQEKISGLLNALEAEKQAKLSAELLAQGVVVELNRVNEEHDLALIQLKEAHAAEISHLNSLHESALMDEKDSGYNEAMADSARETSKLKDKIYRGGYELGLDCGGVPPDSELFVRTVLCPQDHYITEVSTESEGEKDEACPSSSPPPA